MNLRSVGSCYLWCWGTSHSEIRPGSRVPRCVLLCVGPPRAVGRVQISTALHTPREGHPSKRRGPRRPPRRAAVASGRGAWLSLQEHGAATPRAYRGGKETAKLSEFSRT